MEKKEENKRISRADKFGSLREVSFRVSSYLKGFSEVKFTLLQGDLMRDDGNDLLLDVVSSPFGWKPKEDSINPRNLLENDIDKPAQNIDQMMLFMGEIAGLYIEKWKRNYDTGLAIDGLMWIVELRFNKGRTIIREGDSTFPENWDEFIEVLSHYTTVFNFL